MMQDTSKPAPIRQGSAAPAPPRLHQTEFIALIAMMFATIAFSIDAMLPALPEIAADLTPDSPNRAQLIITSFVLGMGVGTFFAGPISDSFGRKRVILAGAVLYCIASMVAYAAESLEIVLAARVVQGLGAAGPRIVTMAMVRDLYAGRQMARIVSFAMMVFTLVPALAPAVGAVIIAASDWRGIFLAFIVFAIAGMLWLGLRQPETLPPAARSPFRLTPLTAAAREVVMHPVVRMSILVQTLLFAGLFGFLSTIQQIFDQSFGRASEFPLWFAAIALISGSASLLNAALVVRLGMRRMVRTALAVQIVASGLMAVITLGDLVPVAAQFPIFVVWTTGVFFMTGLTLGNINAIALEPMGHIAGMAASVTTAIATVAAVVVAIPLGLSFDGTPGPLALGITLLVIIASLLMRRLPG